MAELKVVDGSSPMLFSSNGYKLVVMPMLTGDSRKAEAEQQAAEPESQPAAEAAETTEPETEAAEVKTETTETGEAEAITKTDKPKSKRKRDKKREPVAV
jgi:DNA polymerase-3 subunit beta